jgi:glyoxylase-like metal-dependent hydrolase (beta-lactamase superfamily II)
MFNFDDLRIDRIMDLDPFPLPIGFIFPGAELSDLAAPQRSLLDWHHIDFDRAEVLLGCHSFLLQTADLKILIESCVGENKQRPRLPIWNRREDSGYLARLQAAGIGPDDIDLVLCTHLHADHIGWNTRLAADRWTPTFSNARYLLPAGELDYWERILDNAAPGTFNHGAHEDSFVPLLEAGLVDQVRDGDQIADNMRLVPLPGHTVGQLGVEIDTTDGKLLLCGDALHSPAQVWMPEWTSAFCADKETARETRRSLLRQAAADGTILIPSHMRHSAGMRIVEGDDGFRPVFIDSA